MLPRMIDARFSCADRNPGHGGDFVEAQAFAKEQNGSQAMGIAQPGKRLINFNLQFSTRWLTWLWRRLQRRCAVSVRLCLANAIDAFAAQDPECPTWKHGGIR